MACCNGLKAGDLKHKIIIERQTKTPDGNGGNVLACVTNKTLRAKIKPLSGKERLFASRLEADITHRVTIRYTTDILASDHINYNGRYFNMRALLNMDEANKFIEISADEGVAS